MEGIVLELGERLIPAHAGKTHAETTPCPALPAHPRSRGENPPTKRARAIQTGSSPLTRGKPFTYRQGRVALGLIPAHAGKTCQPPMRPAYRRAHPRSRGENIRARGGAAGAAGSSPLTRGKHPGLRPLPRDHGLIPAHAGKTGAVQVETGQARAHPRSRGENP